MSSELQKFEIQLDRTNHMFLPGEIIAGRVVVDLNASESIRGLKVRIKGKARVNWDDNDGSQSENDGNGSDNDESDNNGNGGDNDDCESDTKKSGKDTNGSGNDDYESGNDDSESENGYDESGNYDYDEETPACHTGEEEYFKIEHYVLKQPGDEKVTIEKGSHVYPFEFRLPQDIPSSFESSHASIRYTVKAIMERPWKYDHKTSVPFTVVTPYFLSECETPLTAIHDEEYETFCCFAFFNIGAIKVDIYLPTNGYTIDDTIQATININNTTTKVDVAKVELQLEQITTLYSSFPDSESKTRTKVVQSVNETGPFNKKDEVVINMQVPWLPCSHMTHCTIIDIEYELRVIVSVSHISGSFRCEAARDKKYPIEIGIKPGFSTLLMQNPTMIPECMPTAPVLPEESPVSLGMMPIHPPPYDEEFPSNARDEQDALAAGSSNCIPTYGSTSTTTNFTGNHSYLPAMAARADFVTPNAAHASTSSGSTEKPPPSYNEVMAMDAKH